MFTCSPILLINGVVSDFYWDFVQSLLHFEGGDGSSIISEEKGAVWTASNPMGYAIPTLTTTDPLVGSSSLLLNQINQRVATVSSADNASGTSFTIEVQVRFSSLGLFQSIFGVIGDPGKRAWVIADTSNLLRWQVGNSTVVTEFTITSGVDYHIEIAKSDTTARLFVNGVLVSEFSSASDLSGTPYIVIGSDGNISDSMLGRVDEFRYTPNVCRHVENFTPPSGPLPNY